MTTKAKNELFFITIKDLNLSDLEQCIYFTLKGIRCPWLLPQADQEKAKCVRQQIIADPTEVVSLELLQQYAQANCCGRPGAEHRYRIEDAGLLEPLAIRWQNEIRQRIAEETIAATSDQDDKNMCSSLTRAPVNSVPSYENDHSLESQTELTSLSIAASKTSLASTELANLTVTSEIVEPRYEFRHRTAEASTVATKLKSKFRPRMTELSKDDTVSFHILSKLQGRDNKTGALYIFKRDSSPGYVKIGWTAKSIQGRLDNWARCGYTPKLIFKVFNVPNAQRAETLTHYELMKEWRAERMCEANWCRKTHREWFEISEERAKQTVADWAAFFKSAQPYDAKGSLKQEWQTIVKAMDENGELITAKALLGRHKAIETATQQPVVDSPIKAASPPSQAPTFDKFTFGVLDPATDAVVGNSFSFAPQGLFKKELSTESPKLVNSTFEERVKSSPVGKTISGIAQTPRPDANPFTSQFPLHNTLPLTNAGLLRPASEASLLFNLASPPGHTPTYAALKETATRKFITPRSMRTFAKKSLVQMTPEPDDLVPVPILITDNRPELIPLPPSPPPDSSGFPEHFTT